MQKYLLSIYQPDDGPIPPPEILEPVMRELAVLNAEMKAAGVWVFSGGLHGVETATVLHQPRDSGDLLVTDGPYTEGKEHLGGLTIIQAPDLDAALVWAKRLSTIVSGLSIELRPFQFDNN